MPVKTEIFTPTDVGDFVVATIDGVVITDAEFIADFVFHELELRFPRNASISLASSPDKRYLSQCELV